MKVAPLSLVTILGLAKGQYYEQSNLRLLSSSSSSKYECNATNADDLSQWESTLDTCNLESQHLSFRACTKINTGKRNNDYQSSAHSYAYYVKQFLTFKTCYHGSNWKKLYFWEQHSDEVCKVETEHTISIPDYFYATQKCVDSYCTECYNKCGERRLQEDEGNDANANQAYDFNSASMNCNSCKSGCTSYATLAGILGDNYSNNQYYSPYCTQVIDQSGVDYYYGPVCSSNGGVSMGFFFDNQCELNVKKDIAIDETSSTVSSSFDLFSFVHGICHDCATGICEDVYESAYHCTADNGTYVAEGGSIINEYEGGYNQNSKDEQDLEAGEELCVKTHKLKDILFYHNHSSRVKAEKKAWEVVGFVALGLLVFGVAAFGFISYTYYVRHCVDWGDSNLMCWTDGCGGCGGDLGDDEDDEDDVVTPSKKKKGRRLV
ncbi:hypothetical protein ACHAWO_004248 [Cyclotella atomus]|uniref:Uncharacterized protein n=1 Tax=Cyclotella atomus TaxID=382360 RepID=A0ABD3NNH0_9STRA